MRKKLLQYSFCSVSDESKVVFVLALIPANSRITRRTSIEQLLLWLNCVGKSHFGRAAKLESTESQVRCVFLAWSCLLVGPLQWVREDVKRKTEISVCLTITIYHIDLPQRHHLVLPVVVDNVQPFYVHVVSVIKADSHVAGDRIRTRRNK